MSTAPQRTRMAEASGAGKVRSVTGEMPNTDERLRQNRAEDQKSVDAERPHLENTVPHESFEALITDMQDNRGIEMTPDLMSQLQGLGEAGSISGHTKNGLEWAVTRDKEGFELFVAENQQETQKAPTEDMVAKMVTEQTQEEAMRQTRAYFDERFGKLDNIIGRRKNEIQTLLEELQGKDEGYDHPISHVREVLKMSDQDEGTLYAIAKAIHDCRPFENIEEGYQKVIDLVKEQLDPRVQTTKAREAFRTKQSWYHTTTEGQAQLAHIHEQTKAAVEARLQQSQMRVDETPSETTVSTPAVPVTDPIESAATVLAQDELLDTADNVQSALDEAA